MPLLDILADTAEEKKLCDSGYVDRNFPKQKKKKGKKGGKIGGAGNKTNNNKKKQEQNSKELWITKVSHMTTGSPEGGEKKEQKQ